jgi:hypothetical protein
MRNYFYVLRFLLPFELYSIRTIVRKRYAVLSWDTRQIQNIIAIVSEVAFTITFLHIANFNKCCCPSPPSPMQKGNGPSHAALQVTRRWSRVGASFESKGQLCNSLSRLIFGAPSHGRGWRHWHETNFANFLLSSSIPGGFSESRQISTRRPASGMLCERMRGLRRDISKCAVGNWCQNQSNTCKSLSVSTGMRNIWNVLS